MLKLSAIKNKKASGAAVVFEAIYKKGGAFKYPKVFRCNTGSEFKSDVTKLLEDVTKLLTFKEQEQNESTLTRFY